jgi:hypothetical protein
MEMTGAKAGLPVRLLLQEKSRDRLMNSLVCNELTVQLFHRPDDQSAYPDRASPAGNVLVLTISVHDSVLGHFLSNATLALQKTDSGSHDVIISRKNSRPPWGVHLIRREVIDIQMQFYFIKRHQFHFSFARDILVNWPGFQEIFQDAWHSFFSGIARWLLLPQTCQNNHPQHGDESGFFVGQDSQ